MESACIVVCPRLRKQWTDYERLDYPIIGVGIDMAMRSRAVGWLPEYMHGRIFWGGFAVSCGIVCWNIPGYFMPGIPAFPLLPQWFTFATGFPTIDFHISFFAFAFAFFVNLDALNLGYRFGIIGSGDIHDGRPGDDLSSLQNMAQSHLTARQGIMGFWAKELTREAAFEAMWNRRVFGTMNVRVYLRFEVCGSFMGSTVRHDGPRQIRLEAASESPFTLIEIVRNGETIQKIEPGECEILWETQDGGSGGMDYYYGRLMREDGQMAWSSPVWVES